VKRKICFVLRWPEQLPAAKLQTQHGRAFKWDLVYNETAYLSITEA
jgi:hypothetical protein